MKIGITGGAGLGCTTDELVPLERGVAEVVRWYVENWRRG